MTLPDKFLIALSINFGIRLPSIERSPSKINFQISAQDTYSKKYGIGDLFIVNNKDARMCEICAKLKIKTLE